MLRLGFDIDGVLADFRSAFLESAVRLLGKGAIRRESAPLPDLDAVSAMDASRVWKVITDTPNWWLSLAPYEPSQLQRLYQLARRHRWEVTFPTSRIPTSGDSVQFQSQAWLEAHGFYMPSVVMVPGSRGEIANALRLDVIVDDQFLNCIEVVGASQSKAILLLRVPDQLLQQEATDRGIGVVHSLGEAIDVLLQLQDILPQKRGRIVRLADWFLRREPESHVLPMNPRAGKPIPPKDT